MTSVANVDMEPYSIDKLMHETRQLAAKYRQTTGATLPVTGEIARFDAAKALGLKLLDNTSIAYDAVGLTPPREGKNILIKGRALFETSRASPRIGQINPQQDWDLVVLVLFDDNYQPIEIYEADKDDIVAALEARQSNRKKRGAMSVAQFKIISRLVWTKEDGLETEVWDNQTD